MDVITKTDSIYVQNKNIITYEDFEDMPMFTSELDNMESLLHGIMNYGFQRPSLIQERGIVPLYKGKNLIAQSQSGTGKTGTFVVGSLSRLEPNLKHVQIVVIAPTHELATQTHHVYSEIAKYIFPDEEGKPKGSGVKQAITLCVGKQVSSEDNIRSIKNGTRIIIGTPGRIHHMISHQIRVGRSSKSVSLIDPKYCKMLILDEADLLLTSRDADIIYEISSILDNPNSRSDYLQLGIFSATFNSDDTLDEARKLCIPKYDAIKQEGGDWTKEKGAPEQILLQPDKLTLEGIVQYYFDLECANDSFNEKAEFIKSLNQEQMIPTCIIYVNSSDTAEHLKETLISGGMACECIYGGLPSVKRLQITDAFRKSVIRILISTDLLARGFDVRQVSLVINFDLPYVYDAKNAQINQQRVADYLHRIGRSGRWGRKGVAINLIATASDHTRKEIIEERYGVKMMELPEDVTNIY
uniref:Helicase n=1 Tax=viral metagenome TaxID=1070528 RepID=A0A6C0J837_9ZZZZ